jgi:hypothetical protein
VVRRNTCITAENTVKGIFRTREKADAWIAGRVAQGALEGRLQAYWCKEHNGYHVGKHYDTLRNSVHKRARTGTMRTA